MHVTHGRGGVWFTGKLKINEAYQSLVPRPAPEEYKALEADIVERGGVTEPIIVNSAT